MTTRTRARILIIAAATRAARGTRAAESATIEARVTRQAARAPATNDAVLAPRD